MHVSGWKDCYELANQTPLASNYSHSLLQDVTTSHRNLPLHCPATKVVIKATPLWEWSMKLTEEIETFTPTVSSNNLLNAVLWICVHLGFSFIILRCRTITTMIAGHIHFTKHLVSIIKADTWEACACRLYCFIDPDLETRYFPEETRFDVSTWNPLVTATAYCSCLAYILFYTLWMIWLGILKISGHWIKLQTFITTCYACIIFNKGEYL